MLRLVPDRLVAARRAPRPRPPASAGTSARDRSSDARVGCGAMSVRRAQAAQAGVGVSYESCSAASRSNPARHISSSPATTSSMIVSISAYGGWKLAATSLGRSRPNSMVYG